MKHFITLLRRILGLVCVAALICCGCSAQPGGTTSNGNAEKPRSIYWLSHDGLDPENGQDLWDAEYERLTGISLRHQYVTGDEYDRRIALYASTGTLPDVFDLGYTFYPQYAATGMLADLTELVHSSGLYDRVDPHMWAQVTMDGRIYGVPREWPSARVTYVRKDWLDRLGMDVPTTYDEFLTMLRRFRDEIPECIIPYSVPDLVSAAYLPEFYQGMQTEIIPQDGQWVDGMLQPGMPAALQRLRDAYTEGLISPDAATSTTAASRDAWLQGCAGVICYWAGNWGQQLTEGLQKNVPEAEVVCIPPIQGAVYLYSRPTVYVINSALSQSQIQQVYQSFIAYMHDGGEGQRLFEFGVEGIHWKEESGHIQMLPSLSDPNQTLNKAYILPSASITPLDSGLDITYPSSYTESLQIAEEYAQPLFFQPASSTYTRIADDLTAMRNDLIAQIVTGGLTVEQGLAQYAVQADAMGIAQALAEMNAG